MSPSWNRNRSHRDQESGLAGIGRCKFCKAEVHWYWTTDHRHIPLDPGKIDNGNLVVDRGLVRYRQPHDLATDFEPRRAHFATCPNYDRTRTPR